MTDEGHQGPQGWIRYQRYYRRLKAEHRGSSYVVSTSTGSAAPRAEAFDGEMTGELRARVVCLEGCEHDLIAVPGDNFRTEIHGRQYILRQRTEDLYELIPDGEIHVCRLSSLVS